MYGIFTYICLIFLINVGKYVIHGSLGIQSFGPSLWTVDVNLLAAQCHSAAPELVFQSAKDRTEDKLLVKCLKYNLY